jgi:hypothetical protein
MHNKAKQRFIEKSSFLGFQTPLGIPEDKGPAAISL